MPSCCIINCKSRTYYAEKKGITFYRFPNEENIRQAWVNACQRSEESLKIDSARICSLHFDDDCFITKWTHSTKAPPKQLRRLKEGSIPTNMLSLEKTRKRKMSNGDMTITSKRIKVLQSFRIPTYSDLLQCNERKEKEPCETSEREEEEREEKVVSPTCIPNETEVQETFERNETEEKGKREEKGACKINVQDKKEGHNYAIKRNINQEVGNDETVVTNTLLELLMHSEKRNKELLNENKELTKINQQLNIQVKELQTNTTQNDPIITKMERDIQEKAEDIAVNALRKIFTPGQIKSLMSSHNVRVKWSSEDIISAIGLRSLSPKAYTYLRNVKQVPLPCVSTLRNWVASFNVAPGILTDVLKIMIDKGNSLSTAEKLTVITFDEIYISNKLDLERREQRIYGPHKTCQFVMARGLFKKWKQPVYYMYDQPMSREILFTVLQHLYQAGYIVVAITCDMGPTNMKLWRDLNIGINTNSHCNNSNVIITEKQCFITHPVDKSLKIFFYADVPHLLKLARNNLFDSGFCVEGNIVDKRCLEELVKLNANDLKIAHKLSRTHLDAKGTKRQNVKLAAQTLSNTNALAVRWCGSNNLIHSVNWKHTADVLKLFNDWFDVFNSSLQYGHHRGLHAYGINLEEQNQTITKVNTFIEEMRVGKKTTLLQFQKGILVCNKSLQEMFTYIKNKYSTEAFQIEYILTRRLNQDIIENFFSYLRSMGAGYDHPTPVEIRNRLKWYILGKHSGHVLSSGVHNEEDCSSSMLVDVEDVRSNNTAETSLNCLWEDENIFEDEIFMDTSMVKDNSMTQRREETEEHDIQEESGEGINTFFTKAIM